MQSPIDLFVSGQNVEKAKQYLIINIINNDSELKLSRPFQVG